MTQSVYNVIITHLRDVLAKPLIWPFLYLITMMKCHPN